MWVKIVALIAPSADVIVVCFTLCKEGDDSLLWLLYHTGQFIF